MRSPSTITVPDNLLRTLKQGLEPSREVMVRVEALQEAMRPVAEFGNERERLARAIGRVLGEQLIELSSLDDRNQCETIFRVLCHLIGDLRFTFQDLGDDALTTFDRELIAFATGVGRVNPAAQTSSPDNH